jgi:hypothetical protein
MSRRAWEQLSQKDRDSLRGLRRAARAERKAKAALDAIAARAHATDLRPRLLRKG